MALLQCCWLVSIIHRLLGLFVPYIPYFSHVLYDDDSLTSFCHIQAWTLVCISGPCMLFVHSDELLLGCRSNSEICLADIWSLTLIVFQRPPFITTMISRSARFTHVSLMALERVAWQVFNIFILDHSLIRVLVLVQRPKESRGTSSQESWRERPGETYRAYRQCHCQWYARTWSPLVSLLCCTTSSIIYVFINSR